MAEETLQPERMEPWVTYWPQLDALAAERLRQLAVVFREWNARLNLVSRKDIEHFEAHHILHAMALGLWRPMPDRARVLDVGTGGGLPGLPLAILYPRAQFFLCDSVAKKAAAVQAMVETLGLRNVTVVNKRAETLESRWDYILGRAVTRLPQFLGWIRSNIREGGTDDFANGVIYWKGSLYAEELAELGIAPTAVVAIEQLMAEPYFEGKYLVHLSRERVMAAQLPEAYCIEKPERAQRAAASKIKKKKGQK